MRDLAVGQRRHLKVEGSTNESGVRANGDRVHAKDKCQSRKSIATLSLIWNIQSTQLQPN